MLKRRAKRVVEQPAFVKCEDCKRATLVTDNLDYRGEPFLMLCDVTGWRQIKDKKRVCKDYE